MSEVSRTRSITPTHIRAIKTACRSHGIKDAEYPLLLNEFGVSTSKSLPRPEASDLLRRLGRPLARALGEQRRARRSSPCHRARIRGRR